MGSAIAPRSPEWPPEAPEIQKSRPNIDFQNFQIIFMDLSFFKAMARGHFPVCPFSFVRFSIFPFSHVFAFFRFSDFLRFGVLACFSIFPKIRNDC